MARSQSPIRSQLVGLRSQLLLANLGVMALTVVMGALAVYQGIAHNLFQQLDQELFTLAEAAAHTLSERHDWEQEWDDDDLNELTLDNDRDFDLSWQTLRQSTQSIELFDATEQRLYQMGPQVPSLPLTHQFQIQTVHSTRLLTLPVYPLDDSQTLQGYVRVSSPTTPINHELRRLQQGLVWGGATALGLCGLGSWGLMRLAMGPIEASFEQLRQFTADASHELRNPLTAIKTSVEVMQSHPERIHPADVAKVAAIADSTQQMSQLVNDLLWLARLDNQTPSSTSILIPLDELLEDLADQYGLLAQAAGLSFKTDLKATGTVRGEIDQLKRLFTNLLDNALKYTPAGGTITLRCQHQEAQVLVEIIDTGVGIAPAHLPRIFDRFWRADPVRSYRDGSGLGLSIVQRIARRHQAQLAVTSDLGQGTTVQIRLPLVR
jgi:signal transduction histidine kinase